MLVFCEECGGRILDVDEDAQRVRCPRCGYVTVLGEGGERRPRLEGTGRASPAGDRLRSDDGDAGQGAA